MLKCNIFKTVVNGAMRIFQGCCYSGSTQDFEQFHSGGEDYNPPKLVKVLADFLSSNKKNGVICLYQDNIERKCAPGEKRIYSTNPSGNKVVSELYLKNDGTIEIMCNRLKFTSIGDIDFKSGTCITLDAPVTDITGNLTSGAGGTSIVMSAGDTLTVTNGILDKKG